MSLSVEMFSSVFRVVWNPSALFVTKYKREVLIFQNVCIQTQGENVSFKQGSLLINASLNNWSIYNLFLIFQWIYLLYCFIFMFVSQNRDEDLDPFLRNSLLFRKKTFGSMLEPQRKPGAVSAADSRKLFPCPILSSSVFCWTKKMFLCFRSELVMMD